MPGELTILGSSSATPTADRHPSSQFLSFGGESILIDCGEAAQMQIMRYGLKMFRISHILISHLHPDHYLGLPGLLSSLSLKGRETPVTIYCHRGLKEILDVQFINSETHISFDIQYRFLQDSPDLLFENDFIRIESFPLSHRTPCCGFMFSEKRLPYRIRKDIPAGNEIPIEAFQKLKQGEDYHSIDGKVYSIADYAIPNTKPTSYCYITDTLFLPELARTLSGKVEVLYHESTFLQDLIIKAIDTNHSTAKQAAEFATIVKARKLIIGHFSSRYRELSPLLEEAKLIFPNTYLGEEGVIFQI